MWFAADDSCCGPKTPIYGTNNKAPSTYERVAEDNTVYGDTLLFDFDKAFWVFNMVTNYAYERWSEVYPEVTAEMVKLE